jgi:hypothetical protein
MNSGHFHSPKIFKELHGANSMSNLTIMTGEQAEASFALSNCPISVGRDPSWDTQILDLKVSRKYAVVHPSDAHHSISPSQALNALLAKGEIIYSETILQEGDEITLGTQSYDTAWWDPPISPTKFINKRLPIAKHAKRIRSSSATRTYKS